LRPVVTAVMTSLVSRPIILRALLIPPTNFTHAVTPSSIQTPNHPTAIAKPLPYGHNTF
jgi:hypothetical protein